MSQTSTGSALQSRRGVTAWESSCVRTGAHRAGECEAAAPGAFLACVGAGVNPAVAVRPFYRSFLRFSRYRKEVFVCVALVHQYMSAQSESASTLAVLEEHSFANEPAAEFLRRPGRSHP